MITTIQVSIETRKRLRQAGYKGETYDSIINRLLTLMEPKESGSIFAQEQRDDQKV